MKTGKVVDSVLSAIVIGLALVIVGAGCGGDDTDNSTVNNTSVTNSIDASVGIDLPDGATEIAPGYYIWIDGDGNAVAFDVTTGEFVTNPPNVVAVGIKGDGNVVSFRMGPAVEEESEEVEE